MKPFWLLLFLCIFSTAGEAQLGIKAGLNVSSLTQTDELISNKSGRTGWNAGLSYRIPISNALAVQPELIYIERGTEFDIEFNVFTTEVEAEYKYVEIPLLVYLGLGDLPLNIHVGPYFGYLADIEYRFNSVLLDGSVEEVIDDDRDNYNRGDYGFVAGVGLELSRVTVDLRFTRGLQQSENGFDFRSVTFNEEAKNVALQAFVGYLLWD